MTSCNSYQDIKNPDDEEFESLVDAISEEMIEEIYGCKANHATKLSVRKQAIAKARQMLEAEEEEVN